MINTKFKYFISILCLTLCLTLILNTTTTLAKQSNYKELTIILDAGQNYKETYKCSPDTYMEVNFTLAITKKVKKYIEEKRPFVNVLESNPDGWNLERGGRGEFALDSNADLLLSLHMDSLGGDWQTNNIGTHIIVDNHSNNRTKNLAKSIVKTYSELTSIPFARKDGFDIRDDGKTQITMLDVASKGGLPAMLLEMTFMDNKEQAVKFKQEDYQWYIAECIALSIIDNFIDKNVEFNQIADNESDVIIKPVTKFIIEDGIKSLIQLPVLPTNNMLVKSINEGLKLNMEISGLNKYIDLYDKAKLELYEANKQLDNIHNSYYVGGFRVIQN